MANSSTKKRGNTHNAGTKYTEMRGRPLLDMPEDEQWRIINETNVMHKLKQSEKKKKRDTPVDEEEIMPLWADSLLLAMPLAIMHAVFEYIIHIQFDFKNDYTISRAARRSLPVFFILFAFGYGAAKVKKLLTAQVVYGIAAFVIGIALVRESLGGDQTFGAMLRTPGLAVLWIWFVSAWSRDLSLQEHSGGVGWTGCRDEELQVVELTVGLVNGQWRDVL
ncbi:hypothetical protein BJ742DRAFT_841794 [Cladochytrium replicatum]|nr:hypothetical protein BJ742DRAFT_841794 [Cladochytrium replicatum]